MIKGKNNTTQQKNTLKSELAQPKPTAKKAKSKSSSSSSFKFSFLKNEKFKQIAGLFFILLGAYIALAIVSYLINYFTYATDDAFTSQITIQKIFVEYPEEIHNWMGRVGAFLSDLMVKQWFGISSILFSVVILSIGFRLLKIKILPLSSTFWYSVFGLLWTSITFGFVFQTFSELLILGGTIGYQTTLWLQGVFGKPGLGILLFFALMSFLVLAYNISLKLGKNRKERNTIMVDEETGEILNPNINKKTGEKNLREDRYNTAEYSVNDALANEDDEDENIPDEEYQPPVLKRNVTQRNPEVEIAVNKIPFMPAEPQRPDYAQKDRKIELTIENPAVDTSPQERKGLDTIKDHYTVDEPFDPTLDLVDYRFPSIDLMNDYGGRSQVQREEIEANSGRIVDTLRNYAIEIDKIKATVGPAVTLYEIIPAPGVRISKIKNLEDDIALSLSALGIRIIAPIPGKGTIGIEVPNQKPDIVSMKSIIGSEAYQNSNYELPFGMGKNIANEAFIADLAKMPHILMAGATGQGKSVGLNAIITSLLYKKHPSELKFVMIDPKKVELTLFSKIERHFLAKLPDCEEAIITDTRVVVRTLNSLCIEMDNRYDLMKDAQVRNIKEYNEKYKGRKLNPLHGHRFLPYIVVVIDEFADLIMTAGKEVELPLTRLAQLARAIGIHLIIATQRPSVNIITGSIKANFPARIAFRVISKIDSRTILDSSGADQLIGRGDMLLSTGSDLIRLQCAFIDLPEIDRITSFIGEQRAPKEFLLPEFADENSEPISDLDPNDRDDLFEEAAKIIVQTQQGSTSLLQRKLKLGYNRAGRIIDQLEAAGIVGPFEGSKAREVKVAGEMALEQFLMDLYSREGKRQDNNF
ncbi:MAG: DNA translocase FtsK [Bacteroidetes bacterium]|nr:DNA translocase FtsK [Bacteroidota bacterium]